jgi:hypothetical protein
VQGISEKLEGKNLIVNGESLEVSFIEEGLKRTVIGHWGECSRLLLLVNGD